MEVFLRRNSISSSSEYSRMFALSTNTDPVVGSISLFMQRTSVDFPLPDSPITTKVSPSLTSKLTFCNATTELYSACTSALDNPSSFPNKSGLSSGPKIFQTFCTLTRISFSLLQFVVVLIYTTLSWKF